VSLTTLALVGVHANPTRAQQDEPVSGVPQAARVEFSVLGGIVGGGDLGSTNASMLANEVPTGTQTSLFTTRTEIGQAAVFEGRVGVRLGHGLWVEGGLGYAQPTLAVDISADVEGAPNVTATSQLTQVIGDVGLHYRWQTSRVSPFVLGGGGYLRQLDEPRTTAETGWVAYGGGGVLVRLTRQPGFWSHVALRGDVRVLWLRDGIILVDQRGPTYQATAGVTIGL
jgi:hypothetical protein